MRSLLNPPPRIVLLPALALVAALSSSPAGARDETPTGFMAADEEMVQKLLRVRTRDELLVELESARKRESAAQADLTEIEGIGAVVAARVGVKKKEIDLLKERARLARKEGNAAKTLELENERKKEEAQLRVFEAMNEAVAGQLARASAAREFARTRIELQEVELDLVDKREARVALAAKPPDDKQREDLAALDREVREASRKVFTSIRDYARRSERLAKTTESLARSNLRLLELWEEYSAR